MEKILSAEEKIRRAEEIYKRRKIKENKIPINTVNIGNSPDFSLLKKTLIKLLFCLMLFLLIYVAKNTHYFFSKDVIDKINEIVSYDMNLQEIYSITSKYLENLVKDFTKFNHTDNMEESNDPINEEMDSNQGIIKNSNEENIGEIKEKNDQNKENDKEIKENYEQNKENNNETNEDKEKSRTNGNKQIKEEDKEVHENHFEVDISDNEIIDSFEYNEMENDVKYIKDNFNLEKPVNGVVTSSFGPRISSDIISANHEGIDIGANEGTKIKSAIQGIVTLVSNIGDYRKSFRNKK